VASLIDGDLGMGYHEREWRGVDDRGRIMPSGVYLARLRAEGRVFVQRLNLIR